MIVSYKNFTRNKNYRYDDQQGPQIKILFINIYAIYATNSTYSSIHYLRIAHIHTMSM